MTKKPVILISIDWFRPAFRAGGPITSIDNLIRLVNKDLEYSIYIITSDTDYGSSIPLMVKTNEWITWPEQNPIAFVKYIPKNELTYLRWKNEIKAISPTCLHIQSMWSFRFSLLPLIAIKNTSVKTILSPRGMLYPTALEQKTLRKKSLLYISKTLGLYKHVIFHATNDEEALHISTYFPYHEIAVIPNAPKVLQYLKSNHKKEAGKLSFICVGRISPEKNPLLILETLKQINQPVVGWFIGGHNNSDYAKLFFQSLNNLPKHHTIEYVGEIAPENLTEWYQKADILISPSIQENFGHAIAEALFSGLPVIVGKNTPLKNLSSFKVGININLETEELSFAIDKFITTSNENYLIISNNCKSFCETHYQIEKIKIKTKEFWS